MKIAFVSNYINHHQIPFCNAMHELLEGEFTFVQTEPMEQERVQMGWDAKGIPAYVKCFYEEPEYCKALIMDADVVVFGGTDEESYITDRLEAGKPVVRYSERLYKTGQWKAISPRGLLKKYHDHTRYRKAPVYLLCSGAYVAGDFRIVRAYPHKMFCWGYFPETKHYDVDELMRQKGFSGADNGRETGEQPGASIPRLLWAGRMIDWKHPELAIETAKYLKDRNLSFHMDIIGGGELYPQMEALAEKYGLQEEVCFRGYQKPEEVRRYMERADIYLFTSDRQEGWGAVANEAMNSGCALVANHMIGAVPYLVQNGENGFIYRDGRNEQLFKRVEQLVKDGQLAERLGRNAYETIVQVWNAENAARSLLELIRTVVLADVTAAQVGSDLPKPCAPAPVLWEHEGAKLAQKLPDDKQSNPTA